MLRPTVRMIGPGMQGALAASAALHACVAALLLVHRAGGALPDDVPPIEVELVQ